MRALAFCLEFLDVELHIQAGAVWPTPMDTRKPQTKNYLLYQHRPVLCMHQTYLTSMLHMHSKINIFLVNGTHTYKLLHLCSNADISQVPWIHYTWNLLLLYRHLLRESHSETQYPYFWQTYPPDLIILHCITKL